MVLAAAQPHTDSTRDQLTDLVEATKAIGDRLRAQILRALSAESYSVSELCATYLQCPSPHSATI
jgi:DNA-binding transcriptional ArsR family regulator